ncbi:lethal(3)malignant brain tumor-like protein 4 [Manis javanica]|uniref:lethal(3)malignant brain tumor-like protein 4 n=1 Tax=Manis javanica TaxID=9974 RepID=UPI003C6DB1E0
MRAKDEPTDWNSTTETSVSIRIYVLSWNTSTLSITIERKASAAKKRSESGQECEQQVEAKMEGSGETEDLEFSKVNQSRRCLSWDGWVATYFPQRQGTECVKSRKDLRDQRTWRDGPVPCEISNLGDERGPPSGAVGRPRGPAAWTGPGSRAGPGGVRVARGEAGRAGGECRQESAGPPSPSPPGARRAPRARRCPTCRPLRTGAAATQSAAVRRDDSALPRLLRPPGACGVRLAFVSLRGWRAPISRFPPSLANARTPFPAPKSAQRLGRLSLKGCCVISVWLRPLTKNTFALTLVDSQAIETLRSATVAMKQPNRKRKLSLDSKEHWNQDGCLEQAEEDKIRDGATSLSHGSRQVVPNPGNR